MIRTVRLSCLIALPLVLAGCGSKEPDAKAMAAGEILEGSISDSMLPLDTVRSQPPLAPETHASRPGAKAEEDEAVDEASDAAAMPTDGATDPAAPPPLITVPNPAVSSPTP